MLDYKDDLTHNVYKMLQKRIYELTRICISEQKYELVRARIGKLIRKHKMNGYREYLEYVMVNEEERTRELINAISTNLTSFFRENQHFDFLKTIVQNAVNKNQTRIRGWSAGCSTGEEVYTMAIVFAEAMGTLLQKSDVKLLASDIDTEVIEHGKQAVYNAKQIANIPLEIKRKYFAKLDGKHNDLYRVADELRNIVAFRHLNLFDPWPFKGKFDFIFCRNVMIYFDKKTQEQLVNNFYEHLANGGYLFIGHSEGLAGIEHKFSYAQPTVYQKI